MIFIKVINILILILMRVHINVDEVSKKFELSQTEEDFFCSALNIEKFR